ncbi:hypothetical protein NJH83_28060 [Pseudomonas chlororaphis]|uniref:hypothetical protein n=1 Tax=Pseudomonas chlororaphis TaxID=587753 RepID=UPI00209B9B13|nr:hypothetical protein [Pseudomonas chlororaphis]MCO7614098.1 hypothetical protein [Pseudomonas chlororaphis]
MTIVNDIKTALATIGGQLNSLKEQLAATNQQIASAHAKLQALYDAPLSLEDYGIYLKATIALRGSEELRTWARERVQTHPSYGSSYAELPWSRFEEANGDLAENPMMLAMTLPNAFDAMCFFMPEVVYEKLMERLREVAGRRWGNTEHPPVAERRQQRDSLQNELRTLQAQRTDLQAQIEAITGEFKK